MAGSGQVTAHTAAMAAAAVHVDNAGQAIKTIQNQVNDAVGATTSGYVSDAATLFRHVMTEWSDDFTQIIQALENIRVALVGSTKNYQGAMDIDSMSVNQVAALLNGTDV